jgi:hypothetical protein
MGCIAEPVSKCKLPIEGLIFQVAHTRTVSNLPSITTRSIVSVSNLHIPLPFQFNLKDPQVQFDFDE